MSNDGFSVWHAAVQVSLSTVAAASTLPCGRGAGGGSWPHLGHQDRKKMRDIPIRR